MKKSQLNKLIKEEIRRVLKESVIEELRIRRKEVIGVTNFGDPDINENIARIQDLSEFMANVEVAIDDLISMIKKEANEIGGSFRSHGIESRVGKLIKAKLQKARL